MVCTLNIIKDMLILEKMKEKSPKCDEVKPNNLKKVIIEKEVNYNLETNTMKRAKTKIQMEQKKS